MNGIKGQIVSLQVCPEHRAPMEMKQVLRASADLGLEGDRHAHAGGTRQVLLMDEETLAAFGLAAGAVKENITTRGIAFKTLTPGMRLRIGSVLLEITKSCTPCSRMDEIRPGLSTALEGQRGMLARILEGGELHVGDAITTEDVG
jgi:MOSC domain-containing protein YiiM